VLLRATPGIWRIYMNSCCRSPAVLISLLVVSTFITTGVHAKPTAAEAGNVLRQTAVSESQGDIAVTDFRYTDGMDGNLMGVPIYIMEYSATIEFKRACRWVSSPPMGQPSLTFRVSPAPANTGAPGATGQFLDTLGNPGEVMPQGRIFTIVGTLRFVKKDSGWVADQYQITKATVFKTAAQIATEGGDRMNALMRALYPKMGEHWNAFDQASPANSREKLAMNFERYGLRLGEKLGDVQKKQPNIKQGPWDWSVALPPGEPFDAVEVSLIFAEDRLAGITVNYPLNRADEVLAALRAEMGDPDKDSPDRDTTGNFMRRLYWWKFPAVVRQIEWYTTDKWASVSTANTNNR